MKIALVTDLHAEEDFTVNNGVDPWVNWKTILADIQTKGIKQLVFLGDIGSPTTHPQFFDSLDQSELDYKLILGNHENFAEVIQTRRPEVIANRTEWYWSEENEVFKSIFLDTSTDAISQTQLDWLKSEVQTEKPILLFVHHPIVQTNTTPHLEFPLEGADQIKEVLLTHDQPVHIFCGHLHLDDHQTADNITQTVTPSASIQAKRHSKKAELEHIGFAYRILEITEDQLDSKVIWFDNIQK